MCFAKDIGCGSLDGQELDLSVLITLCSNKNSKEYALFRNQFALYLFNKFPFELPVFTVIRLLKKADKFLGVLALWKKCMGNQQDRQFSPHAKHSSKDE